MQFSTMFRRSKAGSGFKAIGSDVIPVDAAGNPRAPNAKTEDNCIFARFNSINGWPASRIVCAAKYVGAGVPIAMNVAMYIYDGALGVWLSVPGSGTTLTPVKGNVPAAVCYFDAISLLDMPHVQNDLGGATQGSINQLLIVTDPGTSPNGDYFFSMAADLAAKSY